MSTVDGNAVLAHGTLLFLDRVLITPSPTISLQFRRGDTGGAGAKSIVEGGNPTILFDIDTGQEMVSQVKFQRDGATYRILYRLTSRPFDGVAINEVVYTLLQISG